MADRLEDVEQLLSDDDDDAEPMTAAEVLKKLEEAWLNEKFAPELLECKQDIVECILDQLSVMEENMSRGKKGDFRVSIHRMEVDRIRYILSSYLRLRLQKIEQYARHLLEEANLDDGKSKMSAEETQYAKEFVQSYDTHLHQVALRHMPPNLQAVDASKMMVKPNIDSYVFLQANKEIEGIDVDMGSVESEIVTLDKNSQHLVKYRPVANLIESGDVSLI